MYIAALFPQNFRLKDKLLEATFPLNISLIALLVAAGCHYIFFAGKSKKFTGILEIEKDRILLNDQIIPLEEIDKLRIIGNDIHGEFRGFVSKGTKNKISVWKKDGSLLESGFEQTQNAKLKDQKEILRYWLQSGKLAEANFLNIANNTNYY